MRSSSAGGNWTSKRGASRVRKGLAGRPATQERVDELLLHVLRRHVDDGSGINKLEAVPELRLQVVGAVAMDGKAAAAGRSLGPERRDDGVPAGDDRPGGQLDVVPSIVRIGKEVEDRTVVPDVDVFEIRRARDVGSDPPDV